jgi:hypothetical protein
MILILKKVFIMTTLEDTFHEYDILGNNKSDDECYYGSELPVFPNLICFDYNRINKNKTIEENLKIKHYIKIGEECPICYECIYHKNNAFLTDCGHSFHKTCINKWLIETKVEGDCPICRQDIGEYVGGIYNERIQNSLDKIEDLWLNYDKLLPQYCFNDTYSHIVGFNKYCYRCLQFRKIPDYDR